MIDTPEIVLTAEQRTAVVPLRIPRDEMMAAFGGAMGELMETLGEQGIAPTGPVLARYHEITTEIFDFEVGVPVAEDVAPRGRVKPSTIPALKVAQTIYTGGYDGLPAAWETLEAWLDDQDIEHEDAGWERYLVGPDASEDPSEWKTEINWPIGG